MNEGAVLTDLVARNAATAAERGPAATELLNAAPAEAPALILPDGAISFGDLALRARRLAAGLAGLGVGPGDRVAVWLPNIPEYLDVFFACCHLGAICVAVNTRYRSVEVADIVGRSGAKALVLAPGFKGIDFAGILAGVPADAMPALRHLIVVGEEEVARNGAICTFMADHARSAPLDESRAAPGLPCKIFTTSGTTSGPKFVLHVQATLARHGRDAGAAMGLAAEDAVLFQAIPFCGVFGMAQIMAALAWGRPTILPPAFDAAQAVALMRDHRATHANGADDMLDRLLSAGGGRLNPEFRAFGYARFNPALDDVADRAADGGVACLGLYGMSECMALFSFQPADAPLARRKMGGGVPVSSAARIRVRDPESGEIRPPAEDGPGAAGELEIEGPSVMVGYFGNDAATRATFTSDGWLKTGDLAQATPDGGFLFLNRMGDALRLGGFLTDPREIENHIADHPEVEACQVVGVQRDGKPAAAAFVIARAGARTGARPETRPEPAELEAAILAHCAGKLARFKVPARVFLVESFPVTQSANGVKIQRNRLRQAAQSEIDGTAAAPASQQKETGA